MAIKLDRELPYPAAAVWAIVGTPDRVDWVPGVLSCVFDGEVREFKLPGAGAIKERIFMRDDANMRIEYGVIESPMPLAAHRASITLVPQGEHCRFIWETRVEPVQVEKFILDSMEGSLVQLSDLLSRGN